MILWHYAGMGLNRNHIRFIAEYYRTNPRNAVAAYMAANPKCTKATAESYASVIMARDDVKSEMAHWDAFMSVGAVLEADAFKREIARVAFSDARELTEWNIGACRYCYGDNFRYQRTPAEFERDMSKHIRDCTDKQSGYCSDPLGLTFDVQGGVGFSPKREPHPDCPECHGDGVGYERFNDTRNLSPGAARLFDGVKVTKDGIEIKVRSRDKALAMVGQTLGLLNPKTDPAKPDDGTKRIIVEGGLPRRGKPEPEAKQAEIPE